MIDVAPTLLRLAGASTGKLAGADLRDLPADRAVYAEDFGYLYLPPGAPAERLRRFEYKRYPIESRAVVRWPQKTIESSIDVQSWREEYDLELDPDERVNRAAGAQGPSRRPQRDESLPGVLWRTLRADSDEAALLRFPKRYPKWSRSLGKRRRLPAVLPHRTFDEIENAEPITFIVAVDDPDELRRHVLVSECYLHGGHQWLFVENRGNRAYRSISKLYTDAAARAEHDLRFHVHQDVLFPPDWEDRLFTALTHLTSRDSNWGVIGAAGRAPATAEDSEPPNIGHWSDPHRYHKPPSSGLPAEVQILDELWLGIRASSGLEFDPGLPGFHCYGADLCLTARAAGRKSYVLDAPVIHKLVLPDGTLIEASDQSHKIEGRRTDAFRADFLASADYVARKFEQYLPFQSTCHAYEPLS